MSRRMRVNGYHGNSSVQKYLIYIVEMGGGGGSRVVIKMIKSN